MILLEPSGERTILIQTILPEDPPLHGAALTRLHEAAIVYTIPRSVPWFTAVAESIHSSGGRVALDLEASAPVDDAALPEILRCTDIVLCGLDGLSRAVGHEAVPQDASGLLELGPSQVVVTLGSRGAAAFERSAQCFQTAFRVPVVDTTGAGDCFHAAFLAASLWGEPLEYSLRFAAAAAALSVQREGARGWLPTRAEVEGIPCWPGS